MFSLCKIWAGGIFLAAEEALSTFFLKRASPSSRAFRLSRKVGGALDEDFNKLLVLIFAR